MRRAATPRSDICLMLALVIVGAAVFHPVFSAGFVLVDDHEILSYSDGAWAHPQLGSPPSLVGRLTRLEPENGRTRPLYWLVRRLEIAVLDEQAWVWHVLFVVIGITTAALIFLAMRMAGIGPAAAWVASVWMLVAPGVDTVWIRLGPQESLGTLLVAVSAFAAAKAAIPGSWHGWAWLLPPALGAATLVKESFALVPPALVGLSLFLRY